MIGKRPFVYGCLVAGLLAAPSIATAQLPSYKTPGATAKVKMEQLCAADFATSQKPVANWQRNEALERYGVRPEQFSGELDHLVPVALGGSNDPDNLWPFRGTSALYIQREAGTRPEAPRHGPEIDQRTTDRPATKFTSPIHFTLMSHRAN